MASNPVDERDTDDHGDGRDDGEPRRRTNRMRQGLTLEERRRMRRRDLLDAALELFGTKGYQATSIEELCRTAFVSTRNFYEEFDSREDVLVGLLDAVGAASVRAMEEATERAGGSEELAAGFVAIHSLAHSLLDDPRTARLAFVEARGLSLEHEGRRRAVHRFFAHNLREAFILLGVNFPRLDQPDELFSLAVVGSIDEVLSDFVMRSQDDPALGDHGARVAAIDELVERIAEIVLWMIRQPRLR